jgi:Uma2 family endonuclease
MSSEATTVPETLAEVLDQLGDVPPERIRFQPFPGTATKRDVIAARQGPRRRLCELVDGVLVEKTMGAKESQLALWIGYLVCAYLEKHPAGIALGADGTLEILPNLVRIPDVCFIAADRLPGGTLSDEPIPELVPNLAIEVWSKSNTRKEMRRKLRDYFTAGVEVVWIIYPKTQTAEVYVSPTKAQKVGKDGVLDGGSAVPPSPDPAADWHQHTEDLSWRNP